MQSLQQLLALYPKGSSLNCLFFWGHTPTKKGQIGPFIFSQWYPSPFLIDGLLFPTAEHYMMWSKAKLFNDIHQQTTVLQSSSPKAAKACGRKVQNFDHSIWEAHKVDIVMRANIAKFSQHTDLKDFLLDTRPQILVEASPYDSIWGIGKIAHSSMCDPHNWEGENLLGFVLMEVRERLYSKKLC